eukprot:SAG22_NODE_12361_length_445_cov_1.193642_1_plen_70_part_10
MAAGLPGSPPGGGAALAKTAAAREMLPREKKRQWGSAIRGVRTAAAIARPIGSLQDAGIGDDDDALTALT